VGVTTGEMTLSDRGTSGLAVLPARGKPHIVVNHRHPKCEYPPGRRFVLAHELCHLLHDGEAGRELALISGAWAPRELEQRANAFAAALLMPRDLLRGILAHLPGPLDGQGLLEIARSLHVSRTSLAHHLQNLGLMDESMPEAMLDELAVTRAAGQVA
jgi:Zn-dependent peptidase ImmA (M78 family)